jgi:zinc transport system substrate-binding protein
MIEIMTPTLMKTIIKYNSLKKLLTALFCAVLILCMFFFYQGCGGTKEGNGKLMVAADIVPLADFCRAVGGERVEVETLVPPGASPHTYELTSGQMRFLSQADVLAIVGLELIPWADQVFAKVDNPDLLTVVAGDAVPLSELIPTGKDGTQAEEEGEHSAYNPHVWLDPSLCVYIVEALRDGFAQADPGNASYYEMNAQAYIEELRKLDVDIEEEVATFADRKFVSFHSSWDYFARRYDLEQVGVIEELPGKEPSVSDIAGLIDRVAAQEVKAIFVEPQFDPRAAQAIAEESGGSVVVVTLDPLGDPGDPERNTYTKSMRANVAAMGEVLR